MPSGLFTNRTMATFRNTRGSAKAVLSLGLVIAACSSEIDRRDELGIEEGGRSEVVALGKSQEKPASPASIDGADGADVSREITVEEESFVDQPAVQESETNFSAIRFDPKGTFTVQVAGYRDEKKAQDLVRELNEAGYPAYAIVKPNGDEMRVRIGYFRTQEEADGFGRRFRADRQMEFWVDKRDNE